MSCSTPTANTRRSGPLLWILVLSLACIFAALVAFHGVRLMGMARLDDDLADRLTVTRYAIVSEVERFLYLPRLVAQDARILRLLQRADPDAHPIANTYLKTVRGLSGVDEIYVVDAMGVARATSNWNEPGSFLGHDYGFRPYFRRAIEDGEARYYAVGVTTGKPGYFLAFRIGSEEEPLGVAVAKVDLSELQATWVRAGEAVAVADPLGVVFLSGPQDWLYRPMEALSPGAAAQIANERRYAGLAVEHAVPLGDHLTTDKGDALRVAQSRIAPDDWQVVVGLPLAPVIAMAWLGAALAGLAGLAAATGGMAYRQRRQLLRERLERNAMLEIAVAERTEELAREIEVRRDAEGQLRDTHEQLVQAAKLAVLGRMSSTIVHEVSQPLSALDNTLAAAALHLDREDRARAAQSLSSARSLLTRMQKMVKTLKHFGARQRLDPLEPVDIESIIEAAAEVLGPRLRELDVTLRVALPSDLPRANGHSGRLEQVLTNLILNAAEAGAAESGAEVTVTAVADADAICVTVADRGPGIPPALREKVLEPFFTTRTTGQGLGLGLAITRTMLDQMSGHLSFAERPGGGTLAEVTLTLYQSPAVAEAVQ